MDNQEESVVAALGDLKCIAMKSPAGNRDNDLKPSSTKNAESICSKSSGMNVDMTVTTAKRKYKKHPKEPVHQYPKQPCFVQMITKPKTFVNHR
jgi:hypothetical protein